MADVAHVRMLQEGIQTSTQDESLPTFSAEESAFLREYSETKLRLEALQRSGKARGTMTMAQTQAVLDWAGGVLGKAERLGAKAVCLAVGADLVYACARLKDVCDSKEPRDVIKGLQMLFRIYGITERTQISRQVALVFDSAKGKGTESVPEALPFVMPRTDYAVFDQTVTETS